MGALIRVRGTLISAVRFFPTGALISEVGLFPTGALIRGGALNRVLRVLILKYLDLQLGEGLVTHAASPSHM